VRTYVTFLVSGALALLAFGATMLVHGGWQAALAAFAVVAGVGCLISMVSLLATGERPASPAPSRARSRAIARHAPAAEARREAAPVPVAPLEPPRPKPHPRPRPSLTPS
jgi:hypothetical protein